MAHRLPEPIVETLEQALESARLARSSFDGVEKTEGMKVVIEHKDGRRSVWEGSVTSFIKERVRLHHGSWIIHPLESILQWSQSVDDGTMKEYDLKGRLTGPWPNPEVLNQAAEEVRRLQLENYELKQFKNQVEKALSTLLPAKES